MLFVALTRTSLQHQLPNGGSRQFQFAPGWFLTCATDDFMSRLDVTADKVIAQESLLSGIGSAAEDVSFVAACFVPASQTLEVSKSCVSGRPLYYCTNSRGEFFASTHISWLRRAGVPIETDENVLPELLIYRLVTPPRTLFRGVREMGGAGSIIVDLQSGNLRISEAGRGYDPPDAPMVEPEAATVPRVAEILRSVVMKLAPAAPRVATLLSGGMDSSVLTAIARDDLSAYDTYSSSYPFDGFETNSEQKYALSAANALGTRHTLFAPTAGDFLTAFVEALAAAESPLHHLQSTLLYLLFKVPIPGRSDRIICGLSADTAFGLDTHFAFRPRQNLRQRLLSLTPLYLGLQALGSSSPRARAKAAQVAQFRRLSLPISDPQHPVWNYGAYGDFEWVREHYGASREQIISCRLEKMHALAHRSFNDVLSLFSLNYDAATTATIWSKLAEAQRKILYNPFASREMLDAAFSVPWEVKLKTKKHLTRGVGRRVGVPDFILNRRKESFGVASDRWAERDGALEPLVGLAAKVVDIKQLRDLQSRDPNKAMTLWSLLNYAVLTRLCVKGESKESLLEELAENCRAQKVAKREQAPGTTNDSKNLQARTASGSS